MKVLCHVIPACAGMTVKVSKSRQGLSPLACELVSSRNDGYKIRAIKKAAIRQPFYMHLDAEIHSA